MNLRNGVKPALSYKKLGTCEYLWKFFRMLFVGFVHLMALKKPMLGNVGASGADVAAVQLACWTGMGESLEEFPTFDIKRFRWLFNAFAGFFLPARHFCLRSMMHFGCSEMLLYFFGKKLWKLQKSSKLSTLFQFRRGFWGQLWKYCSVSIIAFSCDIIMKCTVYNNIHISSCINQYTLTYIITPIYFVIIAYIFTCRITRIHISFIHTCIIRYIHMSLCTYSHADYIYIDLYRYHCFYIYHHTWIHRHM